MSFTHTVTVIIQHDYMSMNLDEPPNQRPAARILGGVLRVCGGRGHLSAGGGFPYLTTTTIGKIEISAQPPESETTALKTAQVCG